VGKQDLTSTQTRAAVAAQQVALDGMQHMKQSAVELERKEDAPRSQPPIDLHFDSDLSDFKDDVQIVQLGMSIASTHLPRRN
jgi:hypothetical protein